MKYSSSDLEKIAKYENKRAIKYKKSDSGFYKSILVFSFMCWLWMMIMQMLYILGKTFTVLSGMDKIDNIFVTITVSYFVMLLSVIVYAFRLKLTAFTINLTGIVLSAISFIRITYVSDESSLVGSDISEYDPGIFGVKKVFYLRHGIPMLLVLIGIIVLSFIIIRERIIMKKEYAIISKNNYEPQFLDNNE